MACEMEPHEGGEGENMKPMTFAASLIAICLAGFDLAHAQSVRSLVNEGNDFYKEEKFNNAEVNYRKAIEKDPELVQGHFNLGNSLYKQEEYEDAVEEYENGMARSQEKETKSNAHYNIGNSQFRAQKYQDAVKSYIEALKLDPNDMDAKYNLSYALEKLREQQQQQQNKNEKNQNRQKDKQKDQQDKNNGQKQAQDKQTQQQQEQEKQAQQQQQEQRQEKKQQGSAEKLMSKADAERILDVLKNSEKEVQKKLRSTQRVRAKTDKDW